MFLKGINKKIILPYWIISRKIVLIHVISESILYFLFFKIFDEIFISVISKNSLNHIFINIVWVIFSYLTGRYSETNKKFKKPKFYIIIRSLLNLFLTIIFTTSIFTFTNNSIINIKLYWIDFYNFNKLIILFSLFCFISEIIINRLFIKRNNSKNNRWLFLGSQKIEEKLELKTKLEYKNIDFINILKISDLSKLKGNFSGVIVEDINQIDSVTIHKLNKIKDELPIFSLMEWCEIQLQRYPPELIKDINFISNDLLIEKNLFQLRIKRLFDFCASIILVITTFPIIIICGILIKINDGGPIFYTQIRSGIKGRLFKIIKLRTMKIDAEKEGVQWAKANDIRVTYIGRILRKFRLDELPQLINVISGELSLIGPRPERPEIDEEIRNKIRHYNLRNIIKPGLSGWAQVNYSYGASLEDAENKLSYDLFYIRNFNLILDLLIAIKTIKLISNASGSEPSK